MTAKEMYPNPLALARAVDGYNSKCMNDDVFPDEHGLRLSLNLTKRQIEELCGDKENGEAYTTVFEREKDVRASWLSRKMVTDSKSASGCMNLLKQAANGGYTDRPSENQEKTLKVELVGVGGVKSFK